MSAVIATGAPALAARPWYKILYLQVLMAILLGVVVGWLWLRQREGSEVESLPAKPQTQVV